jgi:hypothetical protein
MFGKKMRILSIFCLLAVCVSSVWGANNRTTPIDVYIIVDSSSAMERGREEAAAWLCNTIKKRRRRPSKAPTAAGNETRPAGQPSA